MFERFTDNARRVIVLAQNTAREMGHADIRPEHLLVGLRRGPGLAAGAMAEAGVDEVALRKRVAARYATKPAAQKIDKVPFSLDGKKCLEQSLRAALALGDNYIGTEHLFFGVQRQADGDAGVLDAVLGVSADEIARRLAEAGATAGPARRSPALRSALERARVRAGGQPVTTGHLVEEMLADQASQVAQALGRLGVEPQRLLDALGAVELATSSDASPAPASIAVTVGETTSVLTDPEEVAALQALSAEQLRDLIRRAIDRPGPGRAAG